MLISTWVRFGMRIRQKRISRGQIITIMVALPMLVWASGSGPDPHSEGGPGGNSTNACAQAGCHTGTAVNSANGKVEIEFPNGLFYTPGERQRLKVTVTDSGARAYGFQASARLGSNETTGQAGTFTPSSGQIVICRNGQTRPSTGCTAANALEFIEHSMPGTTGVFEFDWTPPTTDQGDVRIYVAGNGANGNGSNTGDRIYTANYTLTPRAAGGSAPSITPSGGVTNGASFAPGVVSGSWTTIFGSNLASVTRDWTGAIGPNGEIPTSLEGTSVTIDGKPAFIYFLSPGQLNVQAPDLAGKTGPVQVVVKTSAGESPAVSATAAKELPGLFLFTQTPKKYPAAVRHPDGVFIGPSGLFPGVTTVPAKPGDTILFYGTGFGPTTPAVAPGTVFNGAARLVDSVQMRIGDVTVVPAFAGLALTGQYQFNVTIPTLTAGEHRVEMSINSVAIQSDVVLAVQP